MVGEYDNPTGELRPKGAMASMVGPFVPDDMKKWAEPRRSHLQRDLASLSVRGVNSRATTASHQHGTAEVHSAGSHESHE